MKADYLDLVLIHQPYGDIYGEWHALEKLYSDKKIRAIGVSNFLPFQLVDLCIHSEIKPMVQQIELHPYFQQKQAIEIANEYDIRTQAWSPLGQGKICFSNDELLVRLAEKYNKSVHQIILRWHIQKGISILPRTSSVKHLRENIGIYDFELDNDDMLSIDCLDKGHTAFQDHTDPNTAKLLSVLVRNQYENMPINIDKEFIDYVYSKPKK